jgi:hypothetical protein
MNPKFEWRIIKLCMGSQLCARAAKLTARACTIQFGIVAFQQTRRED